MRSRGSLLRLLALTTTSVGLALAVGCGSGGTAGVEEIDNGFESDDPTGKTAAQRAGGGADAGTSASGNSSSGSGGASAEGASDSSKTAERAVAEADIIKVEGNRLYALSQYGGLSIVDIANPDQMKVLGHKRTAGMPFEMYVENGKAFIMMNDFGRWVRTDGSPYGQWVQSSEILTLDVSNPSAPSEVAHFDVPGSIADSRMVGDVAYVVTYENGSCWRCQTKPATIVTSFKLGAAITQADQLVYSSSDPNFQGWQRSVSATNQRLYIAGRDWSWSQGQDLGSLIQVVDISDPSGRLVKGADVRVAGAITSRWQMDEYAGVLRVVSQFGANFGGNSGVNPKVQTFTVASSSSITPLGQTDLVLPKPESLRSVRFDGVRGYAITAEQRFNIVCDPLFTIDLSNPAAPKQMGELEMPGWVFHIEPRGDRLIAFGYDDIDASRAKVAVSIFDVSGNMSKPTLLQRVAFGQGWSQLTEDQDRIHKAVRIVDDLGLILVPFTSSPRWTNQSCEQAQSGVQLVDFTRDNLTLRGIAPTYGMPRRAVMANGRLLAMSDRNVASFDIASRDTPRKTHDIDLSNPAYRLVELPNHLATITSDWVSGEVQLSLTPKASPDDAALTGKVSLASLATQDATFCGQNRAWTSWYEARLFANGNTVYVTVPVYKYENETDPATQQGMSFRSGKIIAAAVDTTNPEKPVLLGKTESAFVRRQNVYSGWSGWGDGWSFYSYYGASSLVASGQAVVQHGSKLAYLEVDYEPTVTATSSGPYGTGYGEPTIHRRIHVLDFTSPQAPSAIQPIELPASLGSSPLHVMNGVVLTSRWVQSNKNREKVRFFADRVDLNGTPRQLSSVNTPGSLLLVDEPSSRFVTADYLAVRTANADSSTCYQQMGGRGRFDSTTGECVVVSRDFKLSNVAGTKVSLLQTMTLPAQNIAGIQIADDRIFVSRFKRYDYTKPSTIDQNGMYREPPVLEDGGLWAIGGVRAGRLSIVSQLVGDAEWPLAAHGTKVALYSNQGGISIYDTASPVPTLLSEVNLRGYGYSTHILMSGDKATCSLGEWGLQTVHFQP